MPPDPLPRYERELRAFLAPLGVDLDAQAVCFQLYRTSTDVIAAFEAKALRPLGLSHTGFALLTTIWVGGPQEVRSLARKLRLSKPSITSAIGTLERAGLVERERSTDDKRLVSVTLTAQGRRLVRKAMDALHRCELEFTAGLTKTEQRQMAAWLRRVGDAARNGR